MVPTERSLVNLGQGKTTTLIGVLYAVTNKSQPSRTQGRRVSTTTRESMLGLLEEIVVEIVVSRVSTRRLVGGSGLRGLGHGD